jgi:hypothetical protein
MLKNGELRVAPMLRFCGQSSRAGVNKAPSKGFISTHQPTSVKVIVHALYINTQQEEQEQCRRGHDDKQQSAQESEK